MYKTTPNVKSYDVSNQCCVCDQTYEENVKLGGGVEWVQCACLRWLHEDCDLKAVLIVMAKKVMSVLLMTYSADVLTSKYY